MSLQQLFNTQTTHNNQNILMISPEHTLLYAEIDEQGEVSRNNFILLCRDSFHKVNGLYISPSIRELYAFDAYIQGEEMLFILSEYQQQIANFCQKYAEEFEQIFALPPEVYFAAAKHYWHYKVAC